MKHSLCAVWNFAKKYFFFAFLFASMLLPELQLRGMVVPNVFAEKWLGPITVLFSIGWILTILFVCIFILSKKAGRITFIIINSLIIILSFCQYVYFKIFDQFFWLKSIALVGEGADYLGYAAEHVDLKLLTTTLLSVALLVLGAVFWQKPQLRSNRWLALGALPILGIVGLHIFMQPSIFGAKDQDQNWDSWRNPRVVYSQRNDVNKTMEACGLYQMTVRDIYNTIFAPNKYGKKDFAKVTEYFEEQTPSAENEYTDIFKGKNLIAVMLEGIDTWMIHERYTPTMCYMMENGISLENFHSPTFGTGHTFNAEFAFNTGYFSPISAVSAVNFSSNQYPYSMANLFSQAGYSTNSFHYNDSEFYNRGIMHKSFGFEAYNSFPDFDMTVAESMSDSNIIKNDKIYEKMTESQPFFDFVIAYSGHVPYTYDDEKLALAKANHPDLIEPDMDPETNNCLILAADTDDFFRDLLTRLEADGILDDTVILAYTDHYAYGFSDQEKLKGYKKGKGLYQVPAFIYAKDLGGMKVTKPTQTIDMLPTIINLFDLDCPDVFLGNDIFDPQNPGFVYFGDESWIKGDFRYVPTKEDPDEDLRPLIEDGNKRAKESFDITEIVVVGDYFAHTPQK